MVTLFRMVTKKRNHSKFRTFFNPILNTLPYRASKKQKKQARRLIVNLRASVLLLKEGGFLLSRIALQYHRRHRA